MICLLSTFGALDWTFGWERILRLWFCDYDLCSFEYCRYRQ